MTEATHTHEHFAGYISLDDARFDIAFEAPIGASDTEKDAALMASLPKEAATLVQALREHLTIEYLSMGTFAGGADAQQKEMFWAVSGRIPGDDEDSTYVVQARNSDEAQESFEACIWANELGTTEGLEKAKDSVHRLHGQTVFINSVLSSESPMTQHA